MDLEDRNHITKTALEFYANICDNNGHPQLSRKCREMACDLRCKPTTKCNHNII
jgi:hypothetical protein